MAPITEIKQNFASWMSFEPEIEPAKPVYEASSYQETSAQKDYVVMANGKKMPLVGLGTWQGRDPVAFKDALRLALDSGYRYIDTAYLYYNEDLIGEVLEEYITSGKVKREELFVATKLPTQGHKPEDVEHFIQNSLKALRIDYIDLYLMHNACGMAHDDNYQRIEIEPGVYAPDLTPHIETWRMFERYYKMGILKAIGVSNFRADQLLDLHKKAEIKPQNLQIELHIHHRRRDLIALCRELDIVVSSYATLGSPGRLEGFRKAPMGEWPHADNLNHPVTQELAKKYNKTPAQILLRHMVQQGITVIPKSTNPERLKQNFSLFDFELSEEDMQRFDDIKEDVRLFVYPHLVKSPHFPPY
ncbi:unnamed protein product [Bursaphelenchus okinawaensis]|uniref:NADP-dependent oxidoreductase domain-containing protein n=1 Tax=Bursaphelenchus okinawaensis TaxID=465554 RepID=A0A811JRF0_9BILA|nr:unnamed protein product [Bursaphelenchus okinawaensis]CAG9079068.1 unnamed protein product [Bursaphelenchus okinawaensis]